MEFSDLFSESCKLLILSLNARTSVSFTASFTGLSQPLMVIFVILTKLPEIGAYPLMPLYADKILGNMAFIDPVPKWSGLELHPF